ncbi:2Fe-2S iron-sulfur cluster-binding protein [Streptomyces sp. NPDC058662]|uniref:2Fe-2S iron-sulfur cluster-binding protein n=1 Tax=Streptomyces sp. NPDC058662 TaxID=3346583 RepID=UPI00365B29F2
MSGATGNADGAGPAGPDWGWEPVPHGGDYDSDATAFVKLPQDMLDALGTGEPLAAPGHGYVPPPMIVPLGSASTDPAATGTWTLPVQWPEAGAAAAPAGPPSVGGPIPASIPIPASVAASLAASSAASFAEAEPESDPSATAEWHFQPGRDTSGEGLALGGRAGAGRGLGQGLAAASATGQWPAPEQLEHGGDFHQGAPDADPTGDFRQGGLGADWSQAPATLPGGAAAPWANHPDFEAARGYAGRQPAAETGPDAHGAGLLPGTDEAVAASTAEAAAARPFGGPGVGGPRRGPRVLGGPGVGTPLPEAAPAHPAAHDIDSAYDIEAAHGAAATPLAGERPHPGAEPGEGPVAAGPAAEAAQPSAAPHGLDMFGGVRAQARPEGSAEPEGYARSTPPADTDGHGFAAFGHGPDESPVPVPVPVPVADPATGSVPVTGSVPAPGPVPEPEAATDPAADDPAPGTAGTDGRGFAAPDAEGGEGADGAGPEADGPGGAEPLAALPDEDADTGPHGTEQAPAHGDEREAAEAAARLEHPSASYVLRVNGADRPVTAAWIGESLLYVLRERLGLAGAKDGCSQGECGACAVQVDGRLVASCLVPAATAAGSEVRTVEGLATDGELSDVQQALCRSGAVQCGFCVPGMAMTIHDLLEGNHAPSELETRQALCGNLCRCSGYAGVIGAVREVVAERGAVAAGPAPQAPGQAPTPSEPRIPHQAPPGEGGIHHGGTA